MSSQMMKAIELGQHLADDGGSGYTPADIPNLLDCDLYSWLESWGYEWDGREWVDLEDIDYPDVDPVREFDFFTDMDL